MKKSESKYFNTARKMNLALISVLKKKAFEYITVSELCKEAGVNRSTFYLHYEHIGELLEETVRYLLDDFLSYFSCSTRSIAFEIHECEKGKLNFICDEYIMPYLTYVKDNKEVFATASTHIKSLGLDDVYKRMFVNIFNPILDRFHYPEIYRKYVMMYYLNGLNAIVNEWIKDNCKAAMKEISEIMSTCIFGRGEIKL